MELQFDRVVESVALSATGELKTVALAPWGRTKSLQGEFVVDDEAAAAVVAAFSAHGVELGIDIDHASDNDALAPEHRGAVGWITKVYADPGRALLGDVRWTDKGRELIRNGSFQYLSPVLSVRRSDRKVMKVEGAGITNKPAIPAMEKLAASATATTPPDGIGAAVRKRLSLADDASDAEVLLTLSIRLQDTTELTTLREQETNRHANDLVQALVCSHKINPNDKDAIAAAHALARENPDRLEKLFANAKPILPAGQTTPPVRGSVERSRIIASARRKFAEDESIGKVTDCRAFVDLELRESGLSKLSDPEVLQFSIA